MNDKDLNKDYLTIKEFAALVSTTPEALRYYDRQGVFKPAMHGIEFENKYRYYAPTQITAFNMVRTMTDLGVPIKTIKAFSESRTPTKLMKLLTKHEEILADKELFVQDSRSLIGTILELLNLGLSATEDEVYASMLPEKRLIMGGVNDFSDSTGFYREFTRFCNEPHEPKLNLSYPIGGYWDNADEFMREPSRPIRFFSLDPKGHEKKNAGLYLIGYTRGYYGQTGDLPERLAAYAKKNGLIWSGPVYVIYLFDELSVTDPEQYLLRVSISVKETKRVPSRRTYKP